MKIFDSVGQPRQHNNKINIKIRMVKFHTESTSCIVLNGCEQHLAFMTHPWDPIHEELG